MLGSNALPVLMRAVAGEEPLFIFSAYYGTSAPRHPVQAIIYCYNRTRSVKWTYSCKTWSKTSEACRTRPVNTTSAAVAHWGGRHLRCRLTETAYNLHCPLRHGGQSGSRLAFHQRNVGAVEEAVGIHVLAEVGAAYSLTGLRLGLADIG